METGYTHISGGRIFWRQWGSGKPLLICLHGFADVGGRFEPLAEALMGSFSVIAPDLPWHGHTEWEKETFDAWDVQDIVEALCRLNGQAQCILLGHSFGARLTLAALPLIEDSVEAAWIIAPGGFDAGSKWSGERLPDFIRNALIRSVDKHTGTWLKQLSHLVSLGLVGSSAFRFIQSSVETPSRKERLLKVWKNLHHFRIRKSPLVQIHIPLHFVVGEQDALISSHAVRQFCTGIPHARFIRLSKSGHWPDGKTLAELILSDSGL